MRAAGPAAEKRPAFGWAVYPEKRGGEVSENRIPVSLGDLCLRAGHDFHFHRAGEQRVFHLSALYCAAKRLHQHPNGPAYHHANRGRSALDAGGGWLLPPVGPAAGAGAAFSGHRGSLSAVQQYPHSDAVLRGGGAHRHWVWPWGCFPGGAAHPGVVPEENRHGHERCHNRKRHCVPPGADDRDPLGERLRAFGQLLPGGVADSGAGRAGSAACAGRTAGQCTASAGSADTGPS